MSRLDVAILAAKKGANAVQSQTEIRTKKKGKSIVTNADFASERAIIEAIKKHFPEDNIISEESGTETKKSQYTWIIDPIDGTSNFACGFPYYSISIAVDFEGKIILGVILNLVTKELYHAELGKGAFWDNKKIIVKRGKENIILCHEYGYTNASFSVLRKITKKIRVMGCASLDTCQVAHGRFDAAVMVGQKIWDIAAGSIIVSEAGGISSNFSDSLDLKKEEFIFSSKILYPEILRLLK